MSLKASDLSVDDVHEEQLVENLSRTQLVQYAGDKAVYGFQGKIMGKL